MAWSDPKIAQLMESFVPCADEVWHLYYSKTPEADVFRSFCDAGHYGPRKGQGSTRQGMFIVTPKGELLVSWNARRTDVVEAKMREGLKRWEALAKEDRLPAEPLLGEVATIRPETAYPENGLALRAYSRDHPRGDVADDWRKNAWNIDHVWMTRAEAAALAAGKLPEDAAARLFRMQGRDIVRGQSRPYPKESVRHAEVTSRVVSESEGVKIIEIVGRGHVSETGEWHIDDRFDEKAKHTRGFAGTLYGRATWNGERFTAFSAVLSGARVGATQYNERADDLGPAPMAVALELAPKDERVAPSTFWAYGWPLGR